MSKDIREQVSKNYAEALQRTLETEPQEGGSQGSCCGSSATTKASAAGQMAGYEDGLTATQSEAAASSFGCGNPLAFAGVEAGQTVIDLGSGAGLDLLLAAEKVGPQGKVIGIDMTEEMLASARTNIDKAGVAEYVEVRKGIIEDLPVEDGSVDWVISNCVINLSTDKPKVFSEMARVLAKGGRFSVSDIVVEELPEDLRAHALAYSACIGGAIPEEEYLQGLRDAGFGEVEVVERMVYSKEQLESILSCDFGVEEEALAPIRAALASVEGKVWSAKVQGRRV